MEDFNIEPSSYWRIKAEQDIENYTHKLKIPPKQRRKFINAISTIALNVSNGMNFSSALDEAVEFICSRDLSVKLDPEKIRGILLLQEEGSIPDKGKIKIGQVKNVWFQKFNSTDVTALKQRYNFIYPNTPFFWSIHPNFFWVFRNQRPIEGFASPFNFTAKRWCSKYEEDKVFGSIGDFFDVIDKLDSPEELWIINPPYTCYIFNHILGAVKSRRERYPKDRFIFMLPDWKEIELIDYINEEGELYHLEKLKYRIYDYSIERELSPPVDMLVGYIGEPSNDIEVGVHFLEIKNIRDGPRW